MSEWALSLGLVPVTFVYVCMCGSSAMIASFSSGRSGGVHIPVLNTFGGGPVSSCVAGAGKSQ